LVGRVLVWLLIACSLAAGLIVGWGLRARRQTSVHVPAVQRAVAARGDLASDERATVELFEKTAPAVVYITNLAVRRDVFGLNVMELPQGTGSGFVWDERGYVVTNFHVIQGAGAAEVTLADHSSWKARLVGYAADKDLAVLKIDAPSGKLRAILLGSSHDLRVGQKVFAIGNPFGLDHTLTTGIISALNREIRSVTNRPIKGVIQTDAVINPGNSGGPLLDSAGRLIGVNTAIYGPEGTYIGIGFAVPVDTVNEIVPQIISHGKVIRPGLGVRLTDQWNLPGVLVLDVSEDGPAAKAGIRPTTRDEFGRIQLGDLIVSIDGAKVASVDDITTRVEQYKVGDRLRVGIARGGRVMEVELILASLP
jgi:S1-C subfamily serine protease